MGWINLLFDGCNHKWITFDEVEHVWDDGCYYYTEYRQKCEKCGDIRSKNVNKPFMF